MKKLIVTVTFAVLCGNIFAQTPGNTSPGGSSSTPANPAQPVTPHNGTNPTGTPNHNGTHNGTPQDPAKPNTTYPNNPSPGTINGTSPTTPGSTSPTTPGSTRPSTTPGSSTPNSTSPTPHTSSTPHSNINRLYQDPARTPREPRTKDPVRTVNGSTGKYKGDHKTQNGKGFASNDKHIKTSKKRSDNSRETSSNPNTNTTTR